MATQTFTKHIVAGRICLWCKKRILTFVQWFCHYNACHLSFCCVERRKRWRDISAGIWSREGAMPQPCPLDQSHHLSCLWAWTLLTVQSISWSQAPQHSKQLGRIRGWSGVYFFYSMNKKRLSLDHCWVVFHCVAQSLWLQHCLCDNSLRILNQQQASIVFGFGLSRP